MSRKSSRKHAFILIYQTEFQKDLDMDKEAEEYLSQFNSISENDREFIYREIEGTFQHIEKIDLIISNNLSGWSMDRIAKIDLAILRLGIFELLEQTDIPTSVSINEAVELSKIYGDSDSSGFINGLLGEVSMNLRGGK